MRTAKVQRSALVEERVETVAEQESMPGPSGLNDRVMLPAPDAEDEDLSESESDSGDDGDSADFSLEDTNAVYRDWLVTLDREDKKMIAMIIYDNYTSRFGLTNTSAAVEVAQLVGLNEKTI